ncbi:helix-turn-helix domain-containing protein [Rheinheimera tilapiae]|uniref:Helix-turn-helix domain-containing protein n=1 Tax=Rheinheimera tilapiae TaxID=875043 RepID=A0ABV6B8K2_9GAMM
MNEPHFNQTQQIVFEALEAHGTLNTFQLRELGIINPSKMIYDLRLKGLSIKTTLISAIGNTGRIHPRIAHYSLEGQK